MKYSWSKTVFPIAAIFSFRMLGLFLLIPVFSIYANKLPGATPTLVGLALGIYGLSQGFLQMPFGFFSDRWGRKPIITMGLLLFIFGSILGAHAHSIQSMIIARALQGAGAVGSVLIALLADLTPDEQRTKAMAVIGLTIGTSFSLAMVISPALAHRYGLGSLFYFTAALATLGLFLLHFVIPTPNKECFHSDSEANPALFREVLNNKQLQRLNVGIFCQHFILTATFFAIPFILHQQMTAGHLRQQWQFYLPLMVLAFLCMVPFIIFAEKKKHMKEVFLSSVLVITLAQLFLAYAYQSWWGLCLLMLAFFIAFNILEAALPSLISKQANPKCKGTAMGVYSTCQFLGLFMGGILAGTLYQQWGSQGIFWLNASVGLLWLICSYGMQPNLYLATLILSYPLSFADEKLLAKIANLPGVISAELALHEAVLYIRIDNANYVKGSAEHALINYNVSE